jgi:hypothetical protein
MVLHGKLRRGVAGCGPASQGVSRRGKARASPEASLSNHFKPANRRPKPHSR